MTPASESAGGWPELPVASWWETIEALHRWSQIVGKIRMANTPWINHSWNVPLYVAPRGFRSSLIPYGAAGAEGVELAFDLIDHKLEIESTNGQRRSIPLRTGAVADFYDAVIGAMSAVGMPVTINPTPSEIADPVPFDRDDARRSYDRDHAEALWHALLRANRVLTRFRAQFTGKASPVHLFWGSFDLAATRFSGRRAPTHPGGVPNLADDVTREAYSHELSSAGFWPGNRAAPEPLFYSYAYPAPEGYAAALVEPAEASWVEDLGEFVLPYASVARSEDPDGAVLRFFESTYRIASTLGAWDVALECAPPFGPDWWTARPHGSQPTDVDLQK